MQGCGPRCGPGQEPTPVEQQFATMVPGTQACEEWVLTLQGTSGTTSAPGGRWPTSGPCSEGVVWLRHQHHSCTPGASWIHGTAGFTGRLCGFPVLGLRVPVVVTGLCSCFRFSPGSFPGLRADAVWGPGVPSAGHSAPLSMLASRAPCCAGLPLALAALQGSLGFLALSSSALSRHLFTRTSVWAPPPTAQSLLFCVVPLSVFTT